MRFRFRRAVKINFRTMIETKLFSNILYIDDEIHNLNAFRASFRRIYRIFTASSAEEGRKVLDEQEIHVIITDQRMPGTTGIEFLETIIPAYPDPPRILLTGYADISAVIDAINKGSVFKYLQKPWKEEDLKQVIDSALEQYALKKAEQALTEKLIETNEQMEFILRQNLLS